jgi:preprotein translocase subunit SecG
MWETVLVVVIIGTSVFLAGRVLLRNLRGSGKKGCGGSCSGCACASSKSDKTGR